MEKKGWLVSTPQGALLVGIVGAAIWSLIAFAAVMAWRHYIVPRSRRLRSKRDAERFAFEHLKARVAAGEDLPATIAYLMLYGLGCLLCAIGLCFQVSSFAVTMFFGPFGPFKSPPTVRDIVTIVWQALFIGWVGYGFVRCGRRFLDLGDAATKTSYEATSAAWKAREQAPQVTAPEAAAPGTDAPPST